MEARDISTAERVHENVVEVLRSIFDPEIPVNIYDLGLIYGVEIEDGHAKVTMTLTTPHCPEAQTLPPAVEAEVRTVDGIRDCVVDITWEPPWGPERMSEDAKLTLGFDL